MISPPQALKSDIGDILSGCDGLFLGDDDLMLTLFLLYQRHLGPESAWAPYLAALPTPTSVLNWTQEQLLQLQDTHLIAKARGREAAMRQKHARAVAALSAHFPGRLPPAAVAYPAFRWAWMTVQARAFGRRLPWTALVPFADNLNHCNTPVKYDFDTNGNGAFRLFSSGGSGTAAGQEVFNSYGRRSNQHLALEYGFTMPSNEWAHATVQLARGSLPQSATVHLARAQLPISGVFKCNWNKWNTELLQFLRVCLSTEEQLSTFSPAALLAASLDPAREVAALQAARDVFVAALQAYPTALGDDLEACSAAGVPFVPGVDMEVLRCAVDAADAAAGSQRLVAPTAATLAAGEDIASSLAALVAEGQEGAAAGTVDDVLGGAEGLGSARRTAALVHRTTTKLIFAQQAAWHHSASMVARMAVASAATGVGSGKADIPRGSTPLQWAQGLLEAVELRSSGAATDPAAVLVPSDDRDDTEAGAAGAASTTVASLAVDV